MKILRQGNSAIKTYYVEIAGASSEEKPVKDVGAGSLFTETDTGDVYIFDDDLKQWKLKDDDGSSASLIVPELTITEAYDDREYGITCNMTLQEVCDAINSGRCICCKILSPEESVSGGAAIYLNVLLCTDDSVLFQGRMIMEDSGPIFFEEVISATLVPLDELNRIKVFFITHSDPLGDGGRSVSASDSKAEGSMTIMDLFRHISNDTEKK